VIMIIDPNGIAKALGRRLGFPRDLRRNAAHRAGSTTS